MQLSACCALGLDNWIAAPLQQPQHQQVRLVETTLLLSRGPARRWRRPRCPFSLGCLALAVGCRRGIGFRRGAARRRSGAAAAARGSLQHLQGLGRGTRQSEPRLCRDLRQRRVAWRRSFNATYSFVLLLGVGVDQFLQQQLEACLPNHQRVLADEGYLHEYELAHRRAVFYKKVRPRRVGASDNVACGLDDSAVNCRNCSFACAACSLGYLAPSADTCNAGVRSLRTRFGALGCNRGRR